MRHLRSARPIRGDALSCYTAAIATYMERFGIDHEMTIGTQLFTAVRVRRGPGLPFEFLHHHTPLRGRHATHRLELRRRWASEPEATEAILAECRRTGAVIVAADTAHLPWTPQHGTRHAPHWFVIDAVRDDGRIHVRDSLELIAVEGEQRPYAAWLPADRLPSLARMDLGESEWLLRRDRFAFGDAADPIERSAIKGAGYQWYEAPAFSTPRATGPGLLSHLLPLLLARTWSNHTGWQTGSDLHGWVAGTAALRVLAAEFQRRAEDPTIYRAGDDLWVAARARALFAGTLERVAHETNSQPLADLAARCRTTVAEPWTSVPRLMEYNAQTLARGRTPRGHVAEELAGLADAEDSFLDSLRSCLRTTFGIDPAAGIATETVSIEKVRTQARALDLAAL